jgi:hypothetical protein
MDLHLFLTLLSGLCWTLVYVEGIHIGIRDRSYAIPFWALALNLAWELLYTVEGYNNYDLKAQTIINGVWLLLDLGILYTFFRFGRKYFPAQLSRSHFIIWAVLGLATAFILQWLFLHEFGLHPAAKYSAFLQNLLMSILFIAMFVHRGNGEGQSLSIAINKFIGTLAPTIHMGMVDEGPGLFIIVTGSLIAVFDLIYIRLLYRSRKQHQSALYLN